METFFFLKLKKNHNSKNNFIGLISIFLAFSYLIFIILHFFLHRMIKDEFKEINIIKNFIRNIPCILINYFYYFLTIFCLSKFFVQYFLRYKEIKLKFFFLFFPSFLNLILLILIRQFKKTVYFEFFSFFQNLLNLFIIIKKKLFLLGKNMQNFNFFLRLYYFNKN